jgi:ribosomal RNA methyltransferase Nop2
MAQVLIRESAIFEESDSENEFFDSDDHSSSEEELTAFEKQAAAFDAQKSAEAADADAELKTNLADREVVGSSEEDTLDMKAVHQRIQDILFVLSNWNANRPEQGAWSRMSRPQFIDLLVKDCAAYFGYSQELAEKMLELFPPAEALQFFEANETPRPVTLRVNTLKCRRKEVAQALSSRGARVEPIGEWTSVGLKVFESKVPLGATPEYLAGYYMLQSASSFVPVVALTPKENERVLDMSCAPGGKSSYIASMMKNTGVLVANDLSKDRQKATIGNLHRLGVRNAVVTCFDGRELNKHFEKFDRILLDAPCTGLGIIARDPSVKVTRKVDDILKCSKLQKELLLAAIDLTKPWQDGDSTSGGVIVYSTCSVTVEENEDVIAYALKKRNVRLEPIEEIEFGVEGFRKWRNRRFPEQMKLTKRFYPHVHNMDGFFVARLRKLENGPRKVHEEEEKPEPRKRKNKTQNQEIVEENEQAIQLSENQNETKVSKTESKKLKPSLAEDEQQEQESIEPASKLSLIKNLSKRYLGARKN